jgi:hypothetical protein
MTSNQSRGGLLSPTRSGWTAGSPPWRATGSARSSGASSGSRVASTRLPVASHRRSAASSRAPSLRGVFWHGTEGLCQCIAQYVRTELCSTHLRLHPHASVFNVSVMRWACVCVGGGEERCSLLRPSNQRRCRPGFLRAGCFGGVWLHPSNQLACQARWPATTAGACRPRSPPHLRPNGNAAGLRVPLRPRNRNVLVHSQHARAPQRLQRRPRLGRDTAALGLGRGVAGNGEGKEQQKNTDRSD